MTTNFKQFNKELYQIRDKLKEEISDTIKDVVNEIFMALLEPKQSGGTPKISGWLRSNFLISLNVPDTRLIGTKESVSTSVRDNLFRDFKSKDFNTILAANSIIINNLVPYGEIVNDGSSKQMGQFFMEKSVARGTARLNQNRTIKI